MGTKNNPGKFDFSNPGPEKAIEACICADSMVRWRRVNDGSWRQQYVLVSKRGLFWRPHALGYTNRVEEAGRYRKDEAERYASGTTGTNGEVSFCLASEFPGGESK